jgi:hypothetical protein
VEDDGGRVGLAFEPASDERPEIRGTIWLPADEMDVAEIEFGWVHLPWRLMELVDRARRRAEEVDVAARFGGQVWVAWGAERGWHVQRWRMRWPAPEHIRSRRRVRRPGWYVGLIREWDIVLQGG